MEERRVSFAAQNEIDAEQAFLNSMKALQELDEAGASATASEAAVRDDSSVGGGSRDGIDLSSGHDVALIGDTEDQKVTPLPDSGASANVGSAITASLFASTSSGAATSAVKPDATQQSTSTASSPSPPSTASSQRRTAAPFSYDEGDDESGPTGVISDDTGINSANSTAAAPTSSAPPTPAAMAQTFPNVHPVSATPPVSVATSNNTTAPIPPPITLVIPEDISTQTSTQNVTPMSATNEMQQSNSIAGVPQEQSQPSMGVISNSSSNVTVPSTSNTGAGVNAPATSTTPAPAAPSHKRKRLPQDKVGQLEDRIAEDPRGDIDAWFSLIAEHQKKGKFDEARAVFERFFLVFPACVRIEISLCFDYFTV